METSTADKLTTWWLTKSVVVRFFIGFLIAPVVAALVWRSLNLLVPLFFVVLASARIYGGLPLTWTFILVASLIPYVIFSGLSWIVSLDPKLHKT